MLRPSCETDQVSSSVRVTTTRSTLVAPLETTLKPRYSRLFRNKLKGIEVHFRIILRRIVQQSLEITLETRSRTSSAMTPGLKNECRHFESFAQSVGGGVISTLDI